eukprot:gene26155-32690_t
MRNYLVAPGELIHTPEIVRLSDGKVIRKSIQIVSGTATLGFLNKVCYWRATSTVMVIIAALLAGLLYSLCFFFGARGLKKFCDELCTEKNIMYSASLEQSTKTSQPSRLHKYWLMTYDIPVGGEVSVTGSIGRNNQKYWSLVAYDQYGLCLPQYVHDNTVNEITSPGDKSVYSYDIRLMNRAPRSAVSPFKREGMTELDVSCSPKGYVIFRMVHPVDEAAGEFTTPTAVLV